MELNRILTTKGYSIRKAGLSAAQTEQIQKELLVAPKVNSKYMGKAALDALSFKLYRESPSRWYLPRAWATQVFGPVEQSVVPEGTDMRPDLIFQGKPYDYQDAIMTSFIDAGANGLICVPCGKGKTFMALGIAARLKKRFMVIVDKEFLMNQWKGEMEALFPGIRIGIIQEDSKQIGEIEAPKFTVGELKEKLKGLGLSMAGTKEALAARLAEAEPVEPLQYDCSIALIQTLVRRDFGPGDFDTFGFTIFDECHHLGAQHFSKTLQRVQTSKMLGLSATPTREDGLTKVFTWFIGEPVYWEKTREPDPTVEVKGVNIQSEDVNYNTIPTDWRGEPVTARLLTNVLACADRNAKIVEWILKLAAEPRRRILILSERIGHLNAIEELVKAADPTLTQSYYVGGMKQEVRETGAATARIILASYAMASEAMNIKTLNTVVLASPRKAVEQSTGRILRVRPDQREVPPMIVDIIDSHQMYQSQWRKRLDYYKKCSYQVERWSMTGACTPMVFKAAPKSSKCLIAPD